MLRRVLDRLKHGSSSVQYEVQRRTFRGGWKNFHAEFNPTGTNTYDTPPSPPDLSESTNHPPGAFRCIKRVDGLITSVVWKRETPDVEQYYEERRRAEKQKEQLAKMSLTDILQALSDGDTFDALQKQDVLTEIRKKSVQASENQIDDESDTALRDSLVREVAEKQGPNAGLDSLKAVKRAENGLCTYCSSKGRWRCSNCGELVCREHFHSQQEVCHRC